ncbi:DUF881 domain-containing protein [Desulfitobacterium sp.]|uniref:DUF881 domain-containing protein n=1 Tax=Desulfitobacterium sp. TaxID=49981 RepID=UPI002B214A84|nr:DUF881 domain-containing protein [Desulfitobacterium sp.]MEA4902852.1 DUF881 domain-containing protein [Desulfitobacterium sp.]
MKKKVLTISVTFVAVALGVLISLSTQTQKDVEALDQIQSQRVAFANNLLINAQTETAQLQEEHKNLTAQLDEARNQGGTSPALLSLLDQYRMMDGTVAVQGPGIVITIDDRQQEHKTVFPLTTDDLMAIANILHFAGAEAVSINGQRIVAPTAIVMSGSTKLINQVPITRTEGMPYEILAIGNQDQLVDYFSKLEAIGLKQAGISVSIARKNVVIPSYKGVYNIGNGS